jgi:molecular chaperone DnaK (HSP70)
MPYVLGMDIGGTNATAAISRLGAGGWDAPEVVRLDSRSYPVPSVLHLAADGTLAIGDPVRLDPSRLARGFTRRIGDDVPLILGGEPCTPQALTAVLAMLVVERVLAQEGEPAEQIVISHPARWGPYRRGLLRQALSEIGLTRVTLLPEPVVVAEGHTAAAGWSDRALAVYSLGGNDFEASVVRWVDEAGFRLIRRTASTDQFGGADVDELLVEHVRASLGEQFRQLLRAGSSQARLAMFGLRRECARAKERLSEATSTEVVAPLPHGQVPVPVTRDELAELVRPALQVTVDTLARIVRTSGPPGQQLGGVLLVGGASRMPLVAELVATQLAGPVTVEPEPRSLAATGAAVVAGKIATPPQALSPVWTEEPSGVEPSSGEPLGWEPPPALAAEVELSTGPPPRPPVAVTPLQLSSTGQRRFGLVGGRR